MIIAVDFDGTLTERDEFPNIGSPNCALIAKLRERKKQGDKIIIWTCRTGPRVEEMKAWLDFYHVPYDFINENDPERTALYANDSRKVGADVYIDDKAIRPEDWLREVS